MEQDAIFFFYCMIIQSINKLNEKNLDIKKNSNIQYDILSCINNLYAKIRMIQKRNHVHME